MANVIDLTKKVKIVLEKKQIADVKADIFAATDISGSMSGRFRNGNVQEILDRLLAIGMNMDIHKSIDVYAFNDGAQHVGVANEANHKDFVKEVFMKKAPVNGGTNYAPVMHEILAATGTPIKPITVKKEVPKEGFFGKLFGGTKTVTETITPENAKPRLHPAFVFFITDGDNWDRNEAEHVIREASKHGVFWQFIGIGGTDSDFPFLDKLDNMGGRLIDNANFFCANDITTISDEVLYDRLLNEFPQWLKEAKQHNLLA